MSSQVHASHKIDGCGEMLRCTPVHSLAESCVALRLFLFCPFSSEFQISRRLLLYQTKDVGNLVQSRQTFRNEPGGHDVRLGPTNLVCVAYRLVRAPCRVVFASKQSMQKLVESLEASPDRRQSVVMRRRHPVKRDAQHDRFRSDCS